MTTRWPKPLNASSGVRIERIKIDAASADAAGNTLVSAVAGQRIGVMALVLLAKEEVDATLYSGPANTGTALSGAISLAARGGFMLPAPADASLAWMETAAGEALTLKLSAAKQVSGFLVYSVR